jgi:hypothetical protein
MKQKDIIRLFLNIILYTIIILSVYFLYSPLNNNHKNKTSSSIQFVYQQF